ncbi:MAG TPA: multidrug effflux MFS transporter [Alphaproteobacteria bacterium]|nr:multidrug effflux MFS transporter [Alphaproteobacteria bacterium]
MTAIPGPAPALSERAMSLLGALLVAIGPLSLALYTPAMPTVARALATDPAMVKLSLTVYLAGFAVAQLICGPLSDRYGRRPVILGFTGLYILGALACLAAPGIGGLLAGRLVQGIGACASVALSRAMVSDLFKGQTAARIMSTIGMILSVAPAVAPVIGAQLLLFASWRWLFAMMAGYGALLVLLVLLRVPETNHDRDPQALRPGRMAANYLTLLTDARYLRFVLLGALAIGGLFTFSAIVPFVLIDRVGFSPEGYSYLMGTSTGAYFLGAALTNRLLRRRPAAELVGWGAAAILASGLALGGGLALFGPSGWTVMAPVCVWTGGLALIMPGATMGALAPFRTMAGAASALMGALQMGSGVAGSALAAALTDSTLALAVVPGAMAVAGTLAYVALRPAAGGASAAAPAE